MSVSHEVTVWCDWPECYRFVVDIYGLGALRRKLRKMGWTCSVDRTPGHEGNDYCRKHSAEKEHTR